MKALIVIVISIVLILATLNAICFALGLFPSKWATRLAERLKRGHLE